MSRHFTATAQIDRSPAEVFAALADIRTHPDWVDSINSVSNLSDIPTRLGTTWVQQHNVFGRSMTSKHRITEYIEGHRIVHETDQGNRLEFIVDGVGDGTEVTFNAEVEMQGLMKLLGPLVEGKAESMMRDDLANLKAMVEAERVTHS